MRCFALTAVFFALFALFSTLAYAAPVPPQGAMLERRQCTFGVCRDAAVPASGAATSGSGDRFKVVLAVIEQLIGLIGNGSGKAPQPTVVTASQSSTAPPSNPTGA